MITIGTDALEAGEALEVDCMDIEGRLFPEGFPTPYIEGFVVIQSPEDLDVSAVYTTTSLDEKGSLGPHSSIDVERIPGRRIKVTAADEGPPVEYPDLIPKAGLQEGDQYCRLEDGKFVVTVQNQGGGAAGPTTTELIDMTENKIFTMPTPSLDAGSSADVYFEIDRSYGSFRIHVDAKGESAESNEENNFAVANCLG